MKRERSIVSVLIAILVGLIGVGTAFVFFGTDGEEDELFSAFSSDVEPMVDAGPPDAGTESVPQPAQPGLPDPSLAREKYWEPSRDAGPPPDGYGTHFVRLERRLHRHFRNELGEAIELCLDEGRRRGQSFDGKLVFHVTGEPRRGLKLGFRLNGIRSVDEDATPDAGSRRELPPDVFQCIWDTVEATEVSLPVTAAPLIAISQKPDLFVDWEIREESPAGAVEVVDLGSAPANPAPVPEETEGGEEAKNPGDEDSDASDAGAP